MDDLRKLEEDLEKTVIQALGKLCVNERSILWNNARDLALRIVNLYTQMQENTDLLIGNVAYIEESYMLKKMKFESLAKLFFGLSREETSLDLDCVKNLIGS